MHAGLQFPIPHSQLRHGWVHGGPGKCLLQSGSEANIARPSSRQPERQPTPTRRHGKPKPVQATAGLLSVEFRSTVLHVDNAMPLVVVARPARAAIHHRVGGEL